MFGNKMMLPDRGMGPMVFLVVVLLVMIGALIFSSGLVKDPKPVPRDDRRGASTLEFASTPFDPEVSEWGVIADRSTLGQQETPIAALKKAIPTVAAASWNRMRDATNTVREGQTGFATLNALNLLEEPDSWRGAPVEVVGRLVEMHDLDLFDAYDLKLPDGRYSVREGTVELRERTHGAPMRVRFTLLDRPDEDEEPIVPGSEVKVQGVFFKLHRLEGEEGPETGVWLLAKRIFSYFDFPPEDEIDLKTLDLVRDAVTAADADRSIFDERPLFHLLSRVYHGFPVDEEETVKMKGKETRALFDDPEAYRGKVLDIHCRVMKIEHHSLASWFPEVSADDSPIVDFWITYVTSDGYVPLAVIWLEEPKLDLATNNQVRLRAVFYRVWGYRARDRATRSPLLVGLGSIETIDVGQGHGLDPVSIGIAAFILLVLVLVFVVVRFDRRRRALFEETRRARRKLVRSPRLGTGSSAGDDTGGGAVEDD